MKKNVLLIGAGRFGKHMAMQLNQLGHQVMAVDTDENGLSSQSVNLETPEEAPVRYDRAKKRRDDFHEEVEIDPTYQKKKVLLFEAPIFPFQLILKLCLCILLS